MAERLEHERMPTHFFPMEPRTSVPLLAIEKHVFQLGVESNCRIRSERLCEIKAILDVVTHLFAATLAEVEYTVLGAPAPFVPRPCPGNRHTSFVNGWI